MTKLKSKLQKFRRKLGVYVLTNRLFLSYALLTLISCSFLRAFTIGNTFSIFPIMTDLGLILIIGSIGYFIKPKNQYYFFMVLLCIFCFLSLANTIYYKFYASFASVGELATLSQAETVTGAIFEKVNLIDFIYILFPLLFKYVHDKLRNSSYYNYITKIENGKRSVLFTLLVGILVLGIRFINASSSDYSRLVKLWNRESVVDRFGIILYQGNDIFQTISPKINSLFGYEDSLKKFNNYYSENLNEPNKNKYTNIFEGKNVIFVHMESIQSLLMNLSFNGEEVTPTINKLSKEGMFFKRFYPQISTGTSSDTEFTLLSSLMPAASGTIFVSYYNRDYVTIPKLLKEMGYTTFSMHGNDSVMWNRAKAHPILGYDNMYFKESFDFTEDDVINLGINDKLFFKQAIPILEEIEKNNQNYMGTMITLSNHSPFAFMDKYGEYDLSDTFIASDGTTKTTNYLEGSTIGDYIHSAHYADLALGDFIEYINNSECFDDTIFVFYGDHDARISKKNVEYLYNRNKETGEYIEEGEDGYVAYDSFDHELNKNTPLIIWSKNAEVRRKINITVNDVMGMYDVAPTIGNMFGFNNPYALGHDIFDKSKEPIVIFPNGNFLTNEIYYRNSSGEYKILKDHVVLAEDYIDKHLEYVDKRLDISNSIVVFDLLSDQALNDAKSLENKNEEEK